MIFLADFSVIRPEPGLLIWTFIIFVAFYALVGRLAFRPIANALKKRESDISTALGEAQKAREEMASLKSENEQILAQAREERSRILKEAKDAKASMIEDAKNLAKEEANKIIVNAKMEIENQKKEAIKEVKNQVGTMALEIAGKVIQKELMSKADHQEYVSLLVKDIDLN